LGSGVVRDEDGVGAFLGSIEADGEREGGRVSAAGGGGTPPGGCSWAWGGGNEDKRFMRRVSVGLIVLAPSPVA
jgi:hypothetical protein